MARLIVDRERRCLPLAPVVFATKEPGMLASSPCSCERVHSNTSVEMVSWPRENLHSPSGRIDQATHCVLDLLRLKVGNPPSCLTGLTGDVDLN